MKKIIIKVVITILFLVSHLNYSQSIVSEVIYQKKIYVDLSKKEKGVASDILASSLKKMKDLEYVLIFNKKESLFKEKQAMVSDDENSLSNSLSKMLGGGNGVFYTNLKEMEILHQKEFSSKFFIIKSSIKKDKWKVSTENKKIGKDLCYKATSTMTLETIRGAKIKDVTAWYNPNIPSSFGPVGYGGLPGLILELQIGEVVYTAKVISLNKYKNQKIKLPKKGQVVSENEFQRIIKNGFKKYQKN
ncbi:MAG: GLPGLI family protein [Flavobacteriaceae bacterium]